MTAFIACVVIGWHVFFTAKLALVNRIFGLAQRVNSGRKAIGFPERFVSRESSIRSNPVPSPLGRDGPRYAARKQAPARR